MSIATRVQIVAKDTDWLINILDALKSQKCVLVNPKTTNFCRYNWHSIEQLRQKGKGSTWLVLWYFDTCCAQQSRQLAPSTSLMLDHYCIVIGASLITHMKSNEIIQFWRKNLNTSIKNDLKIVSTSRSKLALTG